MADTRYPQGPAYTGTPTEGPAPQASPMCCSSPVNVPPLSHTGSGEPSLGLLALAHAVPTLTSSGHSRGPTAHTAARPATCRHRPPANDQEPQGRAMAAGPWPLQAEASSVQTGEGTALRRHGADPGAQSWDHVVGKAG